MKTAIESAIKVLAEKINIDVKHNEVQQLTQAALNLAHALSIIDNLGR